MQNLGKMVKIIDELSIWEMWRLGFAFGITGSLFRGKTHWKPDGQTNIKEIWWVILELGFLKTV